MHTFRHILVGIDLAHCERLVASRLGPVAAGAVRAALWLAQKTSAEVLFYSWLSASTAALHMLEEEDRSYLKRSLEEAVRKLLADLVQQARDQGVTAQGQ